MLRSVSNNQIFVFNIEKTVRYLLNIFRIVQIVNYRIVRIIRLVQY